MLTFVVQFMGGVARLLIGSFVVSRLWSYVAQRRQWSLQNRWVVVLDDVWEVEHAMPFLFNLPAYLITTRSPELAVTLEAKVVMVNQMSADEATALLSNMIGSEAADEQLLAELAVYLGQWPLLLELVAAQVRQVVGRNEKSVGQAVDEVRERLVARGLTAVDVRDEAACLSAFEIILSVSLHELQALGEQGQNWRERYLELAIFPEHVEIPGPTIFKLWQATAGFEQQDSQNALLAMCDLLLLRYDPERQTVRLHDVAYLGQQVDNYAPLHEALLAVHLPASGKWADLPSDEPYMWRHLASHLCAAGQVERLGGLLLDFTFMQAKLEASDINGLVADYEVYLAHCTAGSFEGPEKRDIEQVQYALGQAGQMLAKDKGELAEELWAHLDYYFSPAVQRLLRQATFPLGTLRLRLLEPLPPRHPALIRTLRGHTHKVTAVAVVGERIISAGDDGMLKVWDLTSGRYLYTLTRHPDRVTGMAVVGQRVVSVSWKSINVSNLADPRDGYAIPGDACESVALTPDGQWMISGGWRCTLEVREVASGRLLKTLTGHNSIIAALAVTPDGQRLISAGRDDTLRLWDLAGDLSPLIIETDSVRVLAITDDGQRMISAGWFKNTLEVWWAGMPRWELATGQLLHTLTGHTYHVTAVAIYGERIISASRDKTLKVWDLTNGRLLNTLTAHSKPITALAISPDGQQIISASDDEAFHVWQADMSIWQADVPQWPGGTPRSDLAPADLLNPRIGHREAITALCVTPDGQRIISASDDQTINVWDLTSGKLLNTLPGHTAAIYGVAAVGERIISASQDLTLKVWDLTSGECLHTLRGHTDSVFGVAVISEISERIISASADQTLKIWDISSGKCLQTLPGHAERVYEVAVTDDGQRIISASEHGTLKIWDLSSGQCLHTLTGHTKRVYKVAVIDDGQWIISASRDETIKIWELTSGRLVTTLTGHTPLLYDAAIIGQLIILVSYHKTVKVYELATNQCLTTFQLDERLNCCTVTPDGQMVIGGSESGRLYVFRLQGEQSSQKKISWPDHPPLEAKTSNFSPPTLPSHFVARPQKESVVNLLLEELEEPPRVLLTTDLGAQEAGGKSVSLRHASVSSGFGKTTLAMAVCHDARIGEHFSDGIHWLTLGPQPDLLQLVNDLAHTFDAESPTYSDLHLAIDELNDLIAAKEALIVLDDVWEYDHVRPFLFDLCACLITTRSPDTPLNPLSRGDFPETPLLRGDLGVCFCLPYMCFRLPGFFRLPSCLCSLVSSLQSPISNLQSPVSNPQSPLPPNQTPVWFLRIFLWLI
ncbi:MAG: NB-ARC domain-containing protein, partial [Ardenticatenaceae bacterium]